MKVNSTNIAHEVNSPWSSSVIENAARSIHAVAQNDFVSAGRLAHQNNDIARGVGKVINDAGQFIKAASHLINDAAQNASNTNRLLKDAGKMFNKAAKMM